MSGHFEFDPPESGSSSASERLPPFVLPGLAAVIVLIVLAVAYGLDRRGAENQRGSTGLENDLTPENSVPDVAPGGVPATGDP